MITAIIFDMNGVITDDEDCHKLVTKKAFDQVSMVITPEMYFSPIISLTLPIIGLKAALETFSHKAGNTIAKARMIRTHLFDFRRI